MSASLDVRTLRVAAGGAAATGLRRPDTGGAHPLSGYLEAHAAHLCGFVLIGAGVAALNVALLYALRSGLRLPDPLAVTVMYACGALVHFCAHRRLNYRAHDRALHPQLGRYALLLTWNFLVMQALVSVASRLSWSPYLAVLAASGTTMISTFLALTHVVFAGRRPRAPATLPPRAALAALGERGLTAGAVLALTDGSGPSPGVGPATQLLITRGALGETTRLLEQGSFDAVVLVLGVIGAGELQSLLAAVAARTAPDTDLVLHLAAVGPQGAAGTPGMPKPPGRRRADARETLHLLLLRCGYDRVWPHAHGRALCVSAKRASLAARARTCSVIVPVYNESPTFPELMRRLLAKRLETLGLEREIIVVESNSTDGTRAQVGGFATTPGVRILWQDRPRGKGHAVRAGLAAATGDMVLIQDADLEYEVDDYDALLRPLLEERAAFVLGSRHSGGAGMRRFTDQRWLGRAANAAHWLFTGVINVLYGQRLRDPFTMFKVFRRDCLYGLEFECDRFDFDHELLIKLLLKGYRPLEIPVSYRSRSFKQGKKIRYLRDPPTWIAADLKYRLQSLRPRLD